MLRALKRKQDSSAEGAFSLLLFLIFFHTGNGQTSSLPFTMKFPRVKFSEGVSIFFRFSSSSSSSSSSLSLRLSLSLLFLLLSLCLCLCLCLCLSLSLSLSVYFSLLSFHHRFLLVFPTLFPPRQRLKSHINMMDMPVVVMQRGT